MSDDTSSEELIDEGVREDTTEEDVQAEAELVEEELDELGQMAKERDEFRDMAQRLQADFENFRKSAQRRGDEVGERQVAQFVASILPVLDVLDLAQAHVSDEASESVEAQALGQARTLFVDTLLKQGLEVVPGQGEPFDPQVHDAVAQAEADEDTSGPIVDEVLRAGYTWRGSVVRPAMVRVKG